MERKKMKARGRSFTSETAPKGRPKISDEEREVNRLTRSKFRAIVQKYLEFNTGELKKLNKDEDTPMLDAMVISVMVMARKNGDERKMNYFIEQLFGKMKEVYEVKADVKTNSNDTIDYSKLSTDEMITLKKLQGKASE